MKQFSFSKHRRLSSTREFSRVYDGRQRASDQHLLIFAVANELGWTRIGLSVSRKHGGAVRRNRIKRLLREAFRLLQHEVPAGFDLILIPRQNSCASLRDYQDSLRNLTTRLSRRIAKREQSESAGGNV